MNRIIIALTTELILKNVSLLVRVITSLARSRITAWVRRVTGNMLPVNVRPVAQDMIIPPFPRVISKTVRLVWIATARPNTKSNPIPVTGLWIAAIWDRKSAPERVSRAMRHCMTIARLVRMSVR